MNPGDITLAALIQGDGAIKYRPSLVLAVLPPFGDLLLCGISTQLRHLQEGFDEIISPDQEDFRRSGFRRSGLRAESLFRLGNLTTYPAHDCAVRVGAVSAARLRRLLTNLSEFLRPSQTP